jgi:hypothetical protein
MMTRSPHPVIHFCVVNGFSLELLGVGQPGDRDD